MLNQANSIYLTFTAAATLFACACHAPGDDARAKAASDTTVAAGTANTPNASSKEITNSIGMRLVFVPKGEFAMGSARGNPNADGDERQHAVTITRDYSIGAFEVTQAQFEQVMGRNPSQFQGAKIPGGGANHPVEQVSWNDAVEFCRRLSERPAEKAAGRVYRLPSEAEWEYACRAGSAGEFAFGNDARQLGDYGWYAANGGDQTHPVGQKKPNAWGLYDMHGNAWEWCADWYEVYSGRPAIDPTGPSQGTDRVYRGGSWNYGAGYCRSANRTEARSSFEGFDFLSISFRVAMDI